MYFLMCMFRNLKKIKLFVLTFLLAAEVLLIPIKGECSTIEYSHVLFISSYSMSFETVPLQVKGIEEIFKNENISLDIEFMDTKRFSSEEDIENFYITLKSKLEKLPKYDAVILGDDAALVFAMDKKEELFKDTPLIFHGINGIQFAKTCGEDPLVTGVIESTSYKDNIELAMKIQPKAKRIIGIVDNTLTGTGDEEQFYSMKNEFKELEFETLNSEDYTFEELGEELDKIDDDTIVLYLSMFKDKTGKNYTIQESVSLIKNHTHVPVYRMSIGGVGEGLLGGIMVSYEESGKIAARIVLEILNGRKPSEIETIMKSPNYGYFDNNILKKYNINPGLLPAESTIINVNPSFYEQYKSIIFFVIGIFVILVLVLAILFFDNYRRKKLMREDYLTKLTNRMSMSQTLERLLSKHTQCAVAMLDIDDFKKVNDSLGHICGDELLIQVADRLSGIENKRIKASRFGGDEFLCVIMESDEQRIKECVEEILSIFKEPFVIREEKHRVHASIGISRAPYDSNDSGELISYADAAMYAVKSAGKNGYEFFNDEMLKEIKHQKYIEEVLRQELDNDGFYMCYQPQIETNTRKLIGFEALLRLRDYNIPPFEFITIAEQTGLIIPIGRIITEMVIKQISKWHSKGYDNFVVAVNFSNVQLRDYAYPDFLKETLEKYNVSPCSIEIEITESIFLKKTNRSMDFMNKIVDLGIKLALDDFGTGYSAINYLTYVPIYKMKLDKSFVDKFSVNNDISTIKNIINLAHGLGLKVTAEGVEEDEQFDILKEVCCDYIQGFLFDRPMTVEEVESKYFK